MTTCDDRVNFSDNSRLLIRGKIVDQNNAPIFDADIGVFAGRSDNFTTGLGFNGSGGGLIARTGSDSDGNFSMITLYPDTEEFSVEVFSDEAFTKYSYRTDIFNFIPTDLTIDLGEIPLRLKSEVIVNINRTSPEGTELEYNLEYQNIFCREVYFEEQLDEELTACYETQQIGGLLNDENSNLSRDLQSLVGSEIVLTYSINGGTQQTQTFTIDQPTYEVNFTY